MTDDWMNLRGFVGAPIIFKGAELSDFNRVVHVWLNEGETDHVYALSREEAQKLADRLSQLGFHHGE